MPANIKGRDLAVDIKRESISAGIKGQEPILKVQFFSCFSFSFFCLFPFYHPHNGQPTTNLG